MLPAFFRFESTLQAAAAMGLSISDYIDNVMNGTPGATQMTLDQMRALAYLPEKSVQYWRSDLDRAAIWKER